MTVNSSEQTSIDLLITLKSQYEYALTETDTKAAYLREQLSHVNALLLNQLLPSGETRPLQAHIEPAADLTLSSPADALDHPALAPSLTATASVQSSSNALESQPSAQKQANAKATPSDSSGKAVSKRSSLPLLPAYQGLRKLEAISQVLEAAQGQEVTIDNIVQTLYGNLSAAAHKAERLRMKTAMFQGVQKKLWQKAVTPSSYLIEASKGKNQKQTPKAAAASNGNGVVATSEAAQSSQPSAGKKASTPKVKSDKTTASKRNSLPLLPEYEGMKKLDAIGLVLEKYLGEVLHHDTIIQTLYGDLSPEDLKAERVRIKTALLTGVKNKRWDKAPKPSSYLLRSGTAQSKPKSSATAAKTSASKAQKKKATSAKA